MLSRPIASPEGGGAVQLWPSTHTLNCRAHSSEVNSSRSDRAAAGWGLFYLFRFVANFGVTYYHDYQLYYLKRQQKWLVEEWGKEVIGEHEEK